ncbi:sensor histidine kinase [Allopusillimonas soli]|uniref:histidine kinase n=1 Tax=Allopusillimonas soli TaxID=659016 RepID=A0A853FD25_9BURK|nr:sensor histidine kinase [Allopusillimonas soli]NYT37638.1 sensor histidine kinase N-terminal domain-containing protein [Allopusillimonas soli]TEA74399.1 sensor histidine kinase [Allopusillimonas soli]
MKTPRFGRGRGLKSILLWSLVPALVIFLMAALWLSNHRLRTQIDIAYDRSLAGALRAIDHQISTASGGLSIELPYLMLQFFEMTANERVYYRVMTEDGLADIGNQQLPLPDKPLVSNVPVFYTAQYLGEGVRIAAMARRMDPPLYNNMGGRVIVLVGEDVDTRQTFINSMLWRSVQRDLVAVVLVILIVVLAVLFAVRPLTRLRQELESRGTDDLRPIEARGLPAEVVPLVTAVNLHMARYARQARLQSQFLDDASHQLRTPLTVLRAQLDYALRESDPQEIRSALQAMREGLDRAVRTANQMLALARARDLSALEEEGVSGLTDLTRLAGVVANDMYSAARARKLDLGLERPSAPILVRGPEWLLREAVVNVLDNALRYTQPGGVVTLSVRMEMGRAMVTVEDDGPGMSADDIAKAGVRFRRGKAGKNTSGAGLGLAIVHAIMQQLQGEFHIASEGRGCLATLVFTPISTGRDRQVGSNRLN